MHVTFFDLKVKVKDKDKDLKDELIEAFYKPLEHVRSFMGPEVEEFEEK